MSQDMPSLSLGQWRSEHRILPLSPRQFWLGYPLWYGQGIEMRRTCSSRSPIEKDRMSLVTDGLFRHIAQLLVIQLVVAPS